jgi:hypothetical protein
MGSVSPVGQMVPGGGMDSSTCRPPGLGAGSGKPEGQAAQRGTQMQPHLPEMTNAPGGVAIMKTWVSYRPSRPYTNPDLGLWFRQVLLVLWVL